MSKRGHLAALIKGLLRVGWKPTNAPEDGKIQRNGQLVRLQWEKTEKSFRIFVYKVTGTGRSRALERRIEITNTYQKALAPALGFSDVVLGYDPDTRIFVGVDARRLDHGGPTGNASSFIELAGLDLANSKKIIIRAKDSNLFGVEYHAYFKAERVSEYFLNMDAIHSGTYDGSGPFSGNSAAPTAATLVVPDGATSGTILTFSGPKGRTSVASDLYRKATDYEAGNVAALKKKKVTPEELMQLSRRLQEIGLKGEEYVLKLERKRLLLADREALADKISWVSQRYPFEGYDILSFDTDGKERFIEVKSTPGKRKQFPISDNEWRTARKLAEKYFIYRVSNVENKPSIQVFQNPFQLERDGEIELNTLTWLLRY